MTRNQLGVEKSEAIRFQKYFENQMLKDPGKKGLSQELPDFKFMLSSNPINQYNWGLFQVPYNLISFSLKSLLINLIALFIKCVNIVLNFSEKNYWLSFFNLKPKILIYIVLSHLG